MKILKIILRDKVDMFFTLFFIAHIFKNRFDFDPFFIVVLFYVIASIIRRAMLWDKLNNFVSPFIREKMGLHPIAGMLPIVKRTAFGWTVYIIVILAFLLIITLYALK